MPSHCRIVALLIDGPKPLMLSTAHSRVVLSHCRPVAVGGGGGTLLFCEKKNSDGPD